MPTATDLLTLAIDKNPTEFADTFNDMVSERIAAALESKKLELAQNIYGENEADEDEDFGEDEFDTDFDDEDDIDLDDEDFDIDLEDLDLEDAFDDETD